MPVILSAAAEAYALNDQQLGFLAASLLSGWLVATAFAFFFLNKAVDRRAAVIFGAGFGALGFIGSQFVETIGLLYFAWGVAGFGVAIIYCVSIQLVAELGQPERAFGFKVVAEVFSGASLLYVFPVFIISTWHYIGASYGLAAICLFSIVLLHWIRSRPQRQQVGREAANRTATKEGWLALFGLLIFLSGITGLWAFIGRIGIDVGVTAEELGAVLAVLKIVGGIAGITVILAGAKYGILWPHILTLGSISLAVFLLYSAQDIYFFAAGAWIWEYGFSLGFGYQCAALARFDSSNRLLLLVPSCIGLAGMIGPALAGSIKSVDSYLNIYIFAVLFAVIPAAIFVRLLSRFGVDQALPKLLETNR